MTSTDQLLLATKAKCVGKTFLGAHECAILQFDEAIKFDGNEWFRGLAYIKNIKEAGIDLDEVTSYDAYFQEQIRKPDFASFCLVSIKKDSPTQEEALEKFSDAYGISVQQTVKHTATQAKDVRLSVTVSAETAKAFEAIALEMVSTGTRSKRAKALKELIACYYLNNR